MSGLENLKTRIQYNGGKTQVERMNKGKLESLKKALLYSYQSATAVLKDGREFRCLINPNKLKTDYDDKEISIPFADVCLNQEKVGTTTEGIQEIGMKPGDVFTWKENNTDWIVYLQKLEETAYFRADIRRCKYEIEIKGKTYKFYAGDPDLNDVVWNKVDGKTWNDLSYSLVMYIEKNEDTMDYFERFKIIKINNKPWEVQSLDEMTVDGIILIGLKEYYQNTIEEAVEEEEKQKEEQKPEQDITIPYINGPEVVYPYDEVSYTIENSENGTWSVSNTKAKIISQSNNEVKIIITTGRSGNFSLIYTTENNEDIILPVEIESL